MQFCGLTNNLILEAQTKHRIYNAAGDRQNERIVMRPLRQHASGCIVKPNVYMSNTFQTVAEACVPWASAWGDCKRLAPLWVPPRSQRNEVGAEAGPKWLSLPQIFWLATFCKYQKCDELLFLGQPQSFGISFIGLPKINYLAGQQFKKLLHEGPKINQKCEATDYGSSRLECFYLRC